MSSSPILRSPFFSRAYGGYTNAQERFIRDRLGAVAGKTIFDPMAGQGYALSRLAWEGATIRLGDLNPAALLLASLRDPLVLRHRSDLTKWLAGILSRLGRKRRHSPKTNLVNGWIAPTTALDLDDYAHLTGLGLFANPFAMTETERGFDFDARFAAAIATLAARDLACFRTSDNLAWLKPGGILRSNRVVGPMRTALNRWRDFADQVASRFPISDTKGSVSSALMNIETGQIGNASKVPWIITSPPYANRLDYTRLWAPEIHVLASMCRGNVDTLKEQQIGTTVVEGLKHYAQWESDLPGVVRRCLSDIRHDSSQYSEIYYYPFFRNYAVALMRALRNIASSLRSNGTLMLFVRDTVRKDTLFPTGQLVTRVLTGKECGLVRIASERRVIKHHIGFLRKASSRGLYGLAQQEWWLVFRKAPKASTNGRATQH